MCNVYTVGQLNSYVKNMFTQDYLLQSVFVRGEVSNCKYHSSGHIYFTLKDAKSAVSCVMFAGQRAGLNFKLAEGQQVVVGGAVDVYERDGRYQLYARQIVLDGAGLLYEKFEQLKAELAECGMFAQEYKQPIPRYIRTLGVVTAETGAAVRDIIRIASRRNPYVQIILYPAIVQGEAAAESIVRGIRALERQQVDVMIVGRGGGSMEDLWAFNERIVAQAVFDCSVPIISAVGHETDTTLIDFVADLRASTPSAAAELAVADIGEVLARLEEDRERLRRLMKRRIDSARERLAICDRQLKFRSPARRIRDKRAHCLRLEEQLQARMDQILREKRHELDLYIERLKGLSPLEKLKSGFSYVEDEGGHNIRSVKGVREGQELTVRVRDGDIRARVTAVRAAL
ncbi:MAG: exodeoxyribonuclease VII large subunit [Clostridium sp.]|nr:exodeoxyribonuclease VII large subunit [Acetatifactor muris]MCM1561994.1 exodeoxyribonuclease VII large subunit [Clostridium sp.]